MLSVTFKLIMLSVFYSEGCKQSFYPECHYGICRFAECRGSLNLVPIKKVYLIGCCWQLLSSKRFRFWTFFQKKTKNLGGVLKLRSRPGNTVTQKMTRVRTDWRIRTVCRCRSRQNIVFLEPLQSAKRQQLSSNWCSFPPCLFFYPWRGFVVDIKARGNTKVQAQSGNRIRPIRSTYFRCSVKMRLLLPVRNSFSGSISGPGTVFTRLRTLCSLRLGPKC